VTAAASDVNLQPGETDVGKSGLAASLPAQDHRTIEIADKAAAAPLRIQSTA
jgi:hypothetical protein